MFKRVSLLLQFCLLCAGVVLFSSQSYGQATITVDAGNLSSSLPHFWSECVGTGTMAYCLKPEWQAAAKIGADEAGFKRVRGHGILMGWNNIDRTGFFHWNGTGTPTYTWGTLDSIYDFIVDSCKMAPIVELSFMPKDLQSNNTCISKPKNYDIWRDMIHELVAHCIERYGLEKVRSWYWEVWNEYDYSGFFNGSANDYYMMYQKAAEGVKRADSLIMVGGPSSTGPDKLQAFVNYCNTNKVKLDFLSNHKYGGGASGPNGDPAVIRDECRQRATVIKNSGKKMYSLNTEYNSSWAGQGGNTGANCVSMDSHVNAPFVAKCVKLILDDHTAGTYLPPDVLSYWAISDVFDEQPPNNGGSFIENHNKVPFGQVFGLINYQGIRKATFNSFKLLHTMGTSRLSLTGGSGTADGVDGFASVNSDSTVVSVLLYNFYTALDGSGGEKNVSLTIKNLPFAAGKIETVRYLIDADHSNPYGVWVKQGKPAVPSDAQWQAMRDAQNISEIEPKAESEYSGAAITRTFTLARQSVTQFVIRKAGITAAADGKRVREVPLSNIFSMSGTVITINSTVKQPGTAAIYSANGRILNVVELSSIHPTDAGKGLAPGVYIVGINAASSTVMRKMIVR